MGTLNVIALISGGKDSFFSILHCLANGHSVIALANLHPPLPSENGTDAEEQPTDDLNSFMYQTVGHTVIRLYGGALGIPLYRQPIVGTTLNAGKNYRPPGDDQPSVSSWPVDETESLVPLLQRILLDYPAANAISTGAILSDYQRTRVESVAVRLGLVPLSYLWQYPHLGCGLETSLLDDMRAVGQDARIIKVASGGLDPSFLWENVAEQRTTRRLLRAMERFGGLGGGAVLGEGGEYETLVVDGPPPLWKKRIDIGGQDRVIVHGGGGSAYLKFTGASLVAKECISPTLSPAEGSQRLGAFGNLHIPKLLGADFDKAIRSIDIGGEVDAGLNSIQPRETVCGGDLVVGDTWVVRRGEAALFISNMVADKRERGSVETEIADVVKRLRTLLESEDKTPDDIAHATILLRSMASFPCVNKAYSTLFARPNPPARATVACGEFLRGGIHVLLSAVVDLGQREFREGLHVQSRSYWAPANIGPYSQAIACPLQLNQDGVCRADSASDSLIYVAGQIPLEPATMEPPNLVGHELGDLFSFRFQVALALQHLWRIGESMCAKWWTGGVAFIARHPDIRRRAVIAGRVWEERNSARWGVCDAGSGGQEEEAIVDIWDRKYGGANAILGNGMTRSLLPNFELIDATGSLVPTSPFFAVEVDELPRGSHIEWSALGVSGPGRIRISDEIEIGSNCCILFKQCLFINGNTAMSYGTIRDGLPNDRFRSALEQMVLLDAKSHPQTVGSEKILQITLYTAKDPGWEAAWDSSSPPLCDLPAVTVMPCRSVWGKDGTRVGAGVVVRSETSSVKAAEDLSGLNAEFMAPQWLDSADAQSGVQGDISPGPSLRQLSRSPHPYRRRKIEPSRWQERPDFSGDHSDFAVLTPSPYPSDRGSGDEAKRNHTGRRHQRDFRSLSDSGTEADDESYTFLRGLPAPPVKLRKGLRDTRGEGIERSLTPPHLRGDETRDLTDYKEWPGADRYDPASKEANKAVERAQRIQRTEFIRRGVEFGLIACVGGLLLCREDVMRILKNWHRAELLCHFAAVVLILLLYPLRILLSQRNHPPPSAPPLKGYIRIPSTFDPAPVLYPILLPAYVALALLADDQRFLTPNLALSLASLPCQFFPGFRGTPGYNTLHWFTTVIPQIASEFIALPLERYTFVPYFPRMPSPCGLEREVLVCLYPLHQALLPVLRYLTTTSLLEAELQLLSTSLINLFIHAVSAQAVILKSLLWGGGITVFVLCAPVLRWGVALARVPKWKFRRAIQVARARSTLLDLLATVRRGRKQNVEDDGDGDSDVRGQFRFRGGRSRHDLRLQTCNVNGSRVVSDEAKESRSATEETKTLGFPDLDLGGVDQPFLPQRRHTLSSLSPPPSLPKRLKLASRDRRKRRTYSTIQSLLSLTYAQAKTRKWLYAGYVYLVIVLTVLVGIRSYIGEAALNGNEPVGWAIGYLFGNVQRLRLLLVEWNLDRWICLPPWETYESNRQPAYQMEYLRRRVLGEANTRLLISGYWLGVLAIGMLAVLRLRDVVEVDTRRKVFHGMMVAMMLPATYIDPVFTSLALGLILAIFLLLDLIRVSQLPPLSKPLAQFLTPYVDGRDLRGPVVVSHIFLLIGCAIPLWLSLAGIKRSGLGCWKGWDVGRREVGMVSGVVCVGMGDAAASLVGRRFGRSKWVWGGGKSIEGSVAFAVAVSVGLAFAKYWLVLGGWAGGSEDGLLMSIGKIGVAACGASLTEAVLTGGNDNVIVPIILWLFTKGLRI
ncbi:hypothetical protein FGG08_003872 [Glutinoglossum americanum]|uniref:Diphthine--ammonia ligase n=1 Tax=Glutinoglossum americanum TaxID=1670608 RepID=A0A9P8L4D7_9PEZI|nr:hypothetical protein FGG08_003872 [Glutinoglossum americanum]